MSLCEVLTMMPGTEWRLKKKSLRDVPGGAGAKTPSSQCRGPKFDPW